MAGLARQVCDEFVALRVAGHGPEFVSLEVLEEAVRKGNLSQYRHGVPALFHGAHLPEQTVFRCAVTDTSAVNQEFSVGVAFCVLGFVLAEGRPECEWIRTLGSDVVCPPPSCTQPCNKIRVLRDGVGHARLPEALGSKQLDANGLPQKSIPQLAHHDARVGPHAGDQRLDACRIQDHVGVDLDKIRRAHTFGAFVDRARERRHMLDDDDVVQRQ